ncbi:MAG TPA: DapH/DapD/GlmU-related protein [Capillimicrobium sp.]|nr:DapH/DapD/GlmU-related protein [Capillimicrobium sp.]
MRRLRERAARARGRLRFARWVRRLRRTLRAHGARLEVDAPHGAVLEALPHVEISEWGRGDGARTVLRIGAGVRIGREVVLELFPGGTNVIELGDGVRVHDHVRLQVRDGALRVGPGCGLRPFAVLKADGELVLEGRNEISYGVILHCAQRVELGLGTGLAERVSVVDSDHVGDGTDRDFYQAPLRVDPVVIEANVFVAAAAIVTRGTRVGRNSVIAAGSVLTGPRTFPAGSLIAGAPARVVRALAPAQEPVSSDR